MISSRFLKIYFAFSSLTTVVILFWEVSNVSPQVRCQNKRSEILHYDRYLISSELSYGRLSNLKISLTEILGLSLALKRTAILPMFESCYKIDGSVEFNQLFDATSLSRVTFLSGSGVDLNRICENDAVSIHVSNDIEDETVKQRTKSTLIDLDSIMIREPYLFGDNSTIEDIFSSYPYDRYFLPDVTLTWYTKHMKDQLLPDKLAALYNRRCIILAKNFLSLNWARLPREFEEIHNQLVPNPSIRADVSDYLKKNSLSSMYGTPFIAIHLRMGDFLEIESFHGFGLMCNNNPELLVSHVKEILAKLGTINGKPPPIVLSTDNYDSNCAAHIQRTFSILSLDGASRFHSNSCQGALFDQEVLGSSAFFFGDRMSTFSQSIHQIRTLRYLHEVDTTRWL